MKIESSDSSTISHTINNNNNTKMAFDMYPSISGKQDPVREVVIKYIDYFIPDASGTSAVAIDNKIEQAMDLVKSHLMIAVREEVEVLKEKISELMDKINTLEVENTILKANMSQETLQQLQMQTQLQIAGSTPVPQITAAATPSPQQNTAAPTAAGAITSGTTTNATAATTANVADATNNTVTAAATVAPGTTPLTTTTNETNAASTIATNGNAGAAVTTNGPMP